MATPFCVLVLSQFTKVESHFCELKTKLSKGFKNTKWLRHFVFWCYVSNSHYETDFGVYSAKVLEIVFFEIPPKVGFQKKRFL